MRIPALLISISFFAVLSAVSCPDLTEKEKISIQIQADPINAFDPGNPSQRRFGSVEFRGGLVLSSSYKWFGGISAMRMQPDGANFIAISDQGFWLRGRIVYSGNRPVGVTDAAMAPILGPPSEKPNRLDAEALAEGGNLLYAGIERVNQILRFDYGKKGFPSRPQLVPVPPGIKDLPNNQGLEGMVFVPRKLQHLGGALIALSERGLTESGDLEAFLIGGPSPGSFAIRRRDAYDISDAALLPDGHLLVLERKYSLPWGVAMRIRRIPLFDIKPGALVDGPKIIETTRREEVDNMESLTVHRARSGEIILTLVSDDNFSPFQRTLLLQFALLGN